MLVKEGLLLFLMCVWISAEPDADPKLHVDIEIDDGVDGGTKPEYDASIKPCMPWSCEYKAAPGKGNQTGPCSRIPIPEYTNVGPAGCGDGCNCYILKAIQPCMPWSCEYEAAPGKGNQTGPCSRIPIPEYTNVGPVGCGDGCNCYILGPRLCAPNRSSTLKPAYNRSSTRKPASNRSSTLKPASNRSSTLKPAGGCPAGFINLGTGECFKYFDDVWRNWTEAISKCAEEGLYLAEPSDQVAVSLYDYMVEKYDPAGATWAYAWLGAATNGSAWVWQHSQTQLLGNNPAWWPGHGNRVDYGMCLALSIHRGNWNDKPGKPYVYNGCTGTMDTLCQMN